MPHILVSGATGFIGRQLCGKFLSDGFKVRAAIWREDAASQNLLDEVEKYPIDSIGPNTDWNGPLLGIDVVVHLAARVHIMNDTLADPLTAYRKVNVQGTEVLARSAAKAGARRFVFLSSVKVHGEESARKYTEEDVLSPQDPYAVSKLEAERILARISKETGLEVVILRPPLVYGPGVKANFLRLLQCVAAGYPLPLARVGNARSMVYVGNLVDAISLCAVLPAAVGKTFLVSDGDDVSTSELIRRIGAALGRPARLLPVPPGLMRLVGKLTGKSAAVDRLLGSLTIDVSKIRKELGWTPPYTMRQGLAATAEWYKNLPN